MNNQEINKLKDKCSLLAIKARNLLVELEISTLKGCAIHLEVSHLEDTIKVFNPSTEIIEILFDLQKIKILDKDMEKYNEHLTKMYNYIRFISTEMITNYIKNIGLEHCKEYEFKHKSVIEIIDEIKEIQKLCPEAPRGIATDMIWYISQYEK